MPFSDFLQEFANYLENFYIAKILFKSILPSLLLEALKEELMFSISIISIVKPVQLNLPSFISKCVSWVIFQEFLKLVQFLELKTLSLIDICVNLLDQICKWLLNNTILSYLNSLVNFSHLFLKTLLKDILKNLKLLTNNFNLNLSNAKHLLLNLRLNREFNF